jgi:hypothetical protein
VDFFSFEISDAAQKKMMTLFGVIGTMASTISSYAKTAKTSWPNVTFPSYEAVAADVRSVTGAKFVATTPLVTDATKLGWESYSVDNQGWIEEGLLQSGVANPDPQDIPVQIYELKDGQALSSENGPFAPTWQVSTPSEETGVVNFNLLSSTSFASAFNLAFENEEALLSGTFDASEIFSLSRSDNASPEAVLVQPMVDDVSSDSSQVVGAVTAVLAWDNFFTGLLHESVTGIVCVVTNTCLQSFTYALDGPNAFYLGPGDLHDTDYDDLAYVVELMPFIALDSDKEESYCEYTLHIYPTQDLHDTYKTKAPAIFTTVIVVIFLISAICFLTYDFLAQRQQLEAMQREAKSKAIVNSLFPAEVRDRLFKDGETEELPKGEIRKGNQFSMLNNEGPQKFRLKNYLTEEENPSGKNKGIVNQNTSDLHESKPIADLVRYEKSLDSFCR